MLAWKQTAKNYRDLLQEALEHIMLLSSVDSELVAAAKQFKEISTKRANPFVPLVGGRDINVEKAKKTLFKVLEDYE